ncbi:transcriptional regulator FilR1 domain-containing protein [Halococcus hamelinensis]|uniref:Putative DNA binding protein n=1 Tax=Halococcus hamelinensis 100A6 TaxID=1132509 RepID=M0M9K1_9EURY|nr:helix-turn-helix domain-containing protein [Halococcus hamelinensis]EMA41998.1 putative DNA binding protein [Halococcus hamelinensis 100A6]
MNARELIEHISRSDQRLAILRALRERSAKPGELAERAGVDRTPVYTALEDLEESGAVAAIEGRRKMTAAGDVAVRETATACEAVGREAISHLASSTDNNRFRVLSGIDDGLSRGEMVHDDAYPSRSTINRAMEDFEASEWITPRPESMVTKEGKEILDAYEELHRVVGIVVEKIAYLRLVDPKKIEFPIELIADAEVVESRPNRPQRADEHLRQRMLEGFDHARMFSRYYSEAGVETMLRALDEGSTWESVSPLPSHNPLPDSRTEIRHFRECIAADGADWRVYPDDLPIDLIIFDDDRVLFGSDEALETTRRDAMLDSTNPALIAWATELFEDYHQQASTPLDYLLDPVRENGLYKALRLDWARDRFS